MSDLPQPGNRRVAAWIYVVINPIIESLRREIDFLGTGNLAWRARSGASEVIRPIPEYVDATQWPNLHDFQIEYPGFVKLFESHDSGVTLLNAAAMKAYEWLVAEGSFQTEVISELGRYEQERSRLGPQYPSFNNSRVELVPSFAENVVNTVETLPAHYLFAPLWNFAGKALLRFRHVPSFEDLESAKHQVGKVGGSLKLDLETKRLQLSRRFDVPAAPVPGLLLES
jgi:hypothetical protein